MISSTTTSAVSTRILQPSRRVLPPKKAQLPIVSRLPLCGMLAVEKPQKLRP